MKNKNLVCYKRERPKLGSLHVENCPQVMITAKARQKLQCYIDLCPEEISGLGVVEPRENDFLITDVFLFEQKVTGGSTELDQKDVGKFLFEAIKSGRDPGKLKVWWHSHVNMGTFWSLHMDEPTIERLQCEYLISLVGTKQGEFQCRIDLYSPFRMTIDDLPLTTVFPEDPSLKAACQKEIKEKVRVSHFPLFEGLSSVLFEKEETPQGGRSDVKIFPGQKLEEGTSEWLGSKGRGEK